MIPYTQRIVVEARHSNKVLLERVVPVGLAGAQLERSIRARYADCSPYKPSRYRIYFSSDARWGVNG